jgi:hypothetical protein
MRGNCGKNSVSLDSYDDAGMIEAGRKFHCGHLDSNLTTGIHSVNFWIPIWREMKTNGELSACMRLAAIGRELVVLDELKGEIGVTGCRL